jgi:hypothetical protein
MSADEMVGRCSSRCAFRLKHCKLGYYAETQFGERNNVSTNRDMDVDTGAGDSRA